MIDPFGRLVSYLRVPVTDRCDFRCVYCMSENMTFLPKKDLLSLEELQRLCGISFAGVTKLRITGGEPLVRRDIMSLFRGLGGLLDGGGLDELTVTTNGSMLDRHAGDLAAAACAASMYPWTLGPGKIPRHYPLGRFDRVMNGLAAADAAGLKVKINAVAMKGVNEDELPDMLAWCHARGYDLTLIR